MHEQLKKRAKEEWELFLFWLRFLMGLNVTKRAESVSTESNEDEHSLKYLPSETRELIDQGLHDLIVKTLTIFRDNHGEGEYPQESLRKIFNEFIAYLTSDFGLPLYGVEIQAKISEKEQSLVSVSLTKTGTYDTITLFAGTIGSLIINQDQITNGLLSPKEFSHSFSVGQRRSQ